jgi:hypothetical protein
MVSSFAFVVIKGPSLIKIISARNQDIIMVYEAVIKVDIYGVKSFVRTYYVCQCTSWILINKNKPIRALTTFKLEGEVT